MFSIVQKLGKAQLHLSPIILNIPRPVTIMGEDAALKLCDNMVGLGVNRVLIVSDKVLNELGVLAPLQARLLEQGVFVYIFDGVLPDPTHGVVEQCMDAFKQQDCDAVLAVGGGSSIDVAKIVALGAANNKSSRQLVGLLRGWKAAKPFFVIPTTAGTGSEVTLGAVVSDDETHQKSIVLNPRTVPLMVALDAGIMAGMPSRITAETGMDALTHAVESYISTVSSSESDFLAMSAVKMIFDNLPLAYKEPGNLKARESMALASHYAGIALNQAGLGYVHGIAHQLGANYGLSHGLSNAIVMPHVLNFSLPAAMPRMASLARYIGVAEAAASDETAARQLITAVKELSATVNIDPCVPGMDERHFSQMSKAALKEAHSTYAVPRYMNEEECRDLLADIAAA